MYYNNNYQSPFMQQQYGQQFQQPQPQPQQTQQNYIPFVYVNGIEGVKTYIVLPNQTVYLKDSDSNMLYEKRADNVGKYYIKAYELKEVDSNNSSPTPTYITQSVIDELKSTFDEKLNKLSKQIKKLEKNGVGNDEQ